jgi:hypothetical protein
MIGSYTPRTITKASLTAVLAVLLTTLSTGAMAQHEERLRHNNHQQDNNQQQSKNDWRNLAIGAAGVSAFGMIQHDPTIGFVGAAGALYSLNRYEQDRKSQSTGAKARASIFSHASIYRNGHQYNRQTVNHNGKKYYRFVKG